MREMMRLAALTLLASGLLWGQPLLDRESLRAVPPDEAIILDPSGPWEPVHWPDSPHTRFAGIDLQDGIPTMVVTEAGKRHPWKYELAIPIDPARYPTIVLTYRATGILASDERLLWLDDTGGPAKGGVVPFLNRDLVADGEAHEISADLRELAPRAEITTIRIYPHCQGPDPAVFELLGLRFESEHDLPPQELVEDAALSLTVVGDDGRPLEGATVTIDSERMNWARSIQTDTSGKATLRPLVNGFGGHTLRVEKEGMITVQLRGRAAAAARHVRLEAGEPYGGTVLNESGEPVPFAAIELVVNGSRSRSKVTTLSDADGNWRTPALPGKPRGLSFTVRHPDYLPGGLRPPPIGELLAGKGVLLVRGGSSLKGVVLAPDGKPVRGARVRLGRDRWRTNQPVVQTDMAGRFAFPQTMPGPTVVTVQHGGYAPAMVEVNVTSGMADPTVQLEPPQRIRGTVVDKEGVPMGGVRVAVLGWRNASTLTWNMTTKANGQFEWPNAPKDTVLFQLTKAGEPSLFNYPMRAEDGEHLVTMCREIGLSGTVKDAETGKPIPEFTITPGVAYWTTQPGAQRAEQWDAPCGFSCEHGRYSLRLTANMVLGPHVRIVHILKVKAPGYQETRSDEFPQGAGERPYNLQLMRKAGEE